MKIMHTVFVSCLCLLVLSGCGESPALSMNKRMAYADSGATLAAAVGLDQVPAEKFDATKEEVAKVCEQLKKFLDDGLVADLPVDVAKKKIEEYMVKQGWQAYVGLIEVIFAWVEVQKVPVEKLGQENILVIKEGLSGVQRQMLRAKKEWAKPFGADRVETTKGAKLTIGSGD